MPGSSKLLLESGLAWSATGDFEKATHAFLAAAAADPNWPLPLLALGVTELQTGHTDRAADAFRKAKGIAPDDYRCYYLRAIALGRSPSIPDSAKRAEVRRELQHAIALNPNNAAVYVALAEAEMPSDSAAAEGHLRKALNLAPADPPALYQLALLERRLGKTAAADRLMDAFRKSKSSLQGQENNVVLILKTLRE
jgi:tetratricopeptide (TPR) repeat protein